MDLPSRIVFHLHVLRSSAQALAGDQQDCHIGSVQLLERFFRDRTDDVRSGLMPQHDPRPSECADAPDGASTACGHARGQHALSVGRRLHDFIFHGGVRGHARLAAIAPPVTFPGLGQAMSSAAEETKTSALPTRLPERHAQSKHQGDHDHSWQPMVATDLIKNDLSGALTRGEFELHYQPIVDMSARRVVGFEALLRWVHPEVGHISPADFIPEAEKSGMISSIGAWVIETACQDAACWGRDLRLAINLSPRQLQDDAFLHTIRHALAMSRLPPERLECEITETAITAHSAKALENVHGLKALGIGVSLDDFGTGYSSLGRLSLFPFDTLKVDRSFVAGADRSPKAQAILKHIIGLGRAIGLRTIAEGVETTLQLGAVARDGCREAQGYLFGAPQPIADALAAIPEIERRLSAIVVPPQGPRP